MPDLNLLDSTETRFALDLETIPQVDDPDFQTPEHWIPFCVTLGFQPEPGAEPEVDVLFRDTDTIKSERDLYMRTIDWIADRAPIENVTIITYNGVSYDIPILRHRTSVVDEQTGSNTRTRLDILLDVCRHEDLILPLKDQHDRWVSLDEALNIHWIDSDSPTWGGEEVTGADMPDMAQDIMTGDASDDLLKAVYRYAASDVAPLFELYDELSPTTPDQ
ncbi:ribonuclease H-like domain-containing protein [Natrarchaeobaculum sulfurireducens]|uniref:Putative exonuclease, contains RNase H-like domain n=1 Tax=Natrarchaeobaculum sulfurireducens TaxID=2044521 RepID=A0A346PMH3_9EURY|nr:ribonuclease H-like domain-containing protein [Natrarchaeobaculum sulfurireducens]AXR80718.1 putative exonuclease, contains RNase H-like domain [Natrarchaeobaculum sulfurireducens]